MPKAKMTKLSAKDTEFVIIKNSYNLFLDLIISFYYCTSFLKLSSHRWIPTSQLFDC